MAVGAALAIGAAVGGWQVYEQKKAQKAQNNIAKQQYELAKKTAQEQEQAVNKVNQKEVDVEGLLEVNSGASDPNLLSGSRGASSKNFINKSSGLLGG